MNTKDKKKLNRSHNDSRPKLLWKSAFEFNSPYTVDECVTQLKELRDRQSPVRVHEIVDNGAIVNFSLSLSYSSSYSRMTGWLLGTIEYRENGETIVRTYTGVDGFTIPSLRYLIPLFFIFIGLVSVPIKPVPLIFAILSCGAILGSDYAYANGLKTSLRQQIEFICT